MASSPGMLHLGLLPHLPLSTLKASRTPLCAARLMLLELTAAHMIPWASSQGQKAFSAFFADVQPYYVTYAEAWTYQAFDIRLENGVFHGRGVNDPKGNVLMVIHVRSPNAMRRAGAAAQHLNTLSRIHVSSVHMDT